MKKLFLSALFFAVVLVSLSHISAGLTLTACGTLNQPNTTYVLLNNITGINGNCFTISANNITLDGNGNAISGDNSGTDYGVFLNGRTNTAIKNFANITGFYYGVYLSLSSNNTLSNIIANSNRIGGVALSSASNNTLSNIIANSNPSYGVALSSASNNNQLSNITTNSNNNYGVYLYSSSNNNINNLFALGNKNNAILDNALGANNYLIQNNSFGQIKWIGNRNNLTMNGTLSFPGNVVIGNNTAYLNTGAFTGNINTSANVTLKGLPTNMISPVILKDGVACGAACHNFTSLNVGTVVFNVSSWSNYSIGESSDIIYPQFSNLGFNYTNGSAYVNGIIYSANATITNTNGTAGIEFNGINYTATNVSNLFVSIIGQLSAGTYSYHWWAYGNGIAHNYNVSATYFYTVNQAASQTGLTFDKATPQIYGTAITPTCSVLSGTGSPTLTVNGTTITSGIPIMLGAGTWTFNCSLATSDNYSASSNYSTFTITKLNPTSLLSISGTTPIDYGTATDFSGTGCPSQLICSLNLTNQIYQAGAISANYSTNGNENYTPGSVVFTVIINKATPNLNLLLDSLPGDKSVDYGTQTNISGYETNSGDSDLVYNLYRNGDIVSNPEISILGAGTYAYIYNVSGGENYSSASLTRTLTVNKAASVVRLFLNDVEGNATITYGTESNATAIGTNGNPVLYRDGNIVSNSEILTFGAGTYNYTAIIADSDNVTGSSITRFLTIDKAIPTLSLLINGTDSDISSPTGTNISIEASAVLPSGVPVELYEDNVLVDSGINPSTIANYATLGDRTWKVNMTESENYTSAEKSHTISIIDEDYPQYSNLKESPTDPATYSQSGNYQFNATWTDNINISDVILEFNGLNYSLSNGELTKNNDEYFRNFSSLGAGTYNYTWYANDTSNNWVATPVQTYTINKAIAALFLSMSPSNNFVYGTGMSIGCYANNQESSPSLTRDAENVTNPDTSLLSAGTYNYACTSNATQNYTDASISGTLIVSKASPIINLSLNGINGDIVFSSAGGDVLINATLIRPSNGNINLTIDGAIIDSGVYSIQNNSYFSAVGTHFVSALFDGDENYTSGSVAYNVVVNTPIGGGGGGGCSYNWNCTEWSTCNQEGKQTRTCSNIGTCSNGYNAPKTEQICAYTALEKTLPLSQKALFDIVLTIIKPQITLGEKLTARISLVNFGNKTNLNVTVNYTITDSKNKTILRQTEIVPVGLQNEFIKEFVLPSQITAGKYNLFAEINYEGQEKEAVSQGSFEILSGKQGFNYWIISISLLVIIIISCYFFIIFKKRKKLRELRKKVKVMEKIMTTST